MGLDHPMGLHPLGISPETHPSHQILLQTRGDTLARLQTLSYHSFLALWDHAPFTSCPRALPPGLPFHTFPLQPFKIHTSALAGLWQHWSTTVTWGRWPHTKFHSVLGQVQSCFGTTVAFIFLLVVSLTSVPLTCCKECLLKLRVLQTVKISNLVSLFDAKCYNPGTVCENVTFQDMTQCSFTEVNQCYRGMYCLHHCLDDGGSTYVWNVSLLLRGYAVSYPTSCLLP
jgi:hypothetical protein